MGKSNYFQTKSSFHRGTEYEYIVNCTRGLLLSVPVDGSVGVIDLIDPDGQSDGIRVNIWSR